MCVKLIKDDCKSYEYDCDKNLMDQIQGCKEILVQYQPNDKEIEKFLLDIQTCAKNGIDPKVKVTVEYGNFLAGYKIKKHVGQVMNDISLNEVVKLLALIQHRIDRTLEEMSSICSNRALDGK